MKKLLCCLGLVLVLVGVSVFTAEAQLYTPNYGSLIPGYVANDDYTFAAISLPFSINYFGTTYNSIYVNNNGNATFGAGTYSYTPSPLNSQATQPMIAPYWTDLDSRSDPLGAIVAKTGGSGVYFAQLSATEVVMTWDRLGYFSTNYSGRASFQLVLRDPNSSIPVGEGVIGFFYGDVTSGTDGHSVQVGFGDGLTAINAGEIALFGGTSGTVSGDVNGEHFWFNLSGTGVPVQPPTGAPEPATMLLLGLGILGLAGVRKFSK